MFEAILQIGGVIFVMALAGALMGCAHHPCTYDQFLTDPNCK